FCFCKRPPALSRRGARDERRAEKPNPRRFLPFVILGALLLLYAGYRIYVWRQPYEWSGTVEARTISVGSRAGGRVKEVLVREGDLCEEGQALLTLEPGDWPAQLVQAQAQLALAEANLEKLKRGARPEEIEQ